MKDGTINELIDEEIIDENDLEVIHQVAELTSRCLAMPGDRRPPMWHVAQELYRLIGLVRRCPHAVGDLIAFPELARSFTGTMDSPGYTGNRTTKYFTLEKKS